MDDDGSGEIDCQEFEQLLGSDAFTQDMTFEVFYEAMFQLVDLWTADPPVAENYEAFLIAMFGNVTSGEGGTLRLRDLRKYDDENGELRYELQTEMVMASVEDITSFADEETGQVVIEGVEINEAAWGSEPEPEPEQICCPGCGVDMPEAILCSSCLADAEAKRAAARERARLREEAEAARLAAEAEDARLAREAALAALRAAEETRRLAAEKRRLNRLAEDKTQPLSRSQAGAKQRREDARRRKQELKDAEVERRIALAEAVAKRPMWWKQVDRLLEKLPALQPARLDGNFS